MAYRLAWRLLIDFDGFASVYGAFEPELTQQCLVELIMTQSYLLILAIAASLGLNLLAGVHLLRSKRNESNRQNTPDGFRTPALPEHSSFPDNWVPTSDEPFSPLVEAEVYFAYGRRDDAEAALASGLRDGLISADEIERLRARLSIK